MNIVFSSKIAAYVVLAGIGVFVGLATHHPELVLLGVPFAVALMAGLGSTRRPEITVHARLSAARVLEGDPIEVTWVIEHARAVGRVELTMGLPPGIRTEGGHDPLCMLDLDGAGPTAASEPLRAVRWGRWPIEDVAWQALDPSRFVSYEAVLESSLVVQVHPTPEQLREIVAPVHAAISTGSHTSRDAGEGIEFLDVRPFSPGEHVRGINWRATARHGGELWMNRQHLERNADVVLLVDAFNDAALGIAVRAALRLATAYAGRRDRIGIVSFGGMLRWVEPGTGTRHLYRVLDALLLTKTSFSYVWADPSFVPARTLPPGALVFAISPLDDERAFAAVRNLRHRGVDLVVIEVDPPGFAAPGPRSSDQLAHRIWAMSREAHRGELRSLGVPVVAWSDDRPLSEALTEISAFRRRQRRRAG